MNLIQTTSRWFRSLRPAGRKSAEPARYRVEPTAKLRLEDTLDRWSQWWYRSGDESSERLAAERAEREFEKYFGRRALEDLKASAAASDHGSVIFAADRVIEALLGRRAAMAVTRRLYSNLR